MRLVKVKANALRIRLCCVKCGAVKPEVDFMADLDGAPFKDYYCPVCAQLIQKEVTK